MHWDLSASPIPPESPWPPPCMIRTFPPWAARNRIPSDGRAIQRSCNGIRCPIGCMELRRACHSACPESVMISTGRCSMPRNLDDNSFSNLLYPPNLTTNKKTSNANLCDYLEYFLLQFTRSAVFYCSAYSKLDKKIDCHDIVQTPRSGTACRATQW